MVRNEAALESAIYYVDKEEDKTSRSRHMVRFWLYCVAFLVFLMVVGGRYYSSHRLGAFHYRMETHPWRHPAMSVEEWNEEFLNISRFLNMSILTRE